MTWLAGWALARRLSPDLTRAETAAWSAAAGLLLQAGLFVLLAAAGIDPGGDALLAGNAAAIAAAFLIPGRRSRLALPPPPAPPRGPLDPVAIFAAAVAALAFLAFLVPAVAEPMWSTDFLAIWGMKGQAIYLAGSLPARIFQDPALYWSHREYPLLVPLVLAAIARLAGGWNDQALAILFPAVELSTLLLLYGFVGRRTGSLRAGTASAALAALCFPLYHPVNAGTAEIPFAFGAVLAASAGLDSLGGGSKAVALRLGISALFCAGAKQEGTLFAFLLAAAVVMAGLHRRTGPPWRAAILLALVPSAHWLLLRLLRGSQSRRDFDFHFLEPSGWPEFAARFGGVISRMILREGREAIVPLLAIALFLLFTRRRFADLLLPVIGAQLFFYAVAFSLSSFDPMYAVDGAFRRIATTLFPVLSLVLASRLTVPQNAARDVALV
ncbi:MAG: hypothetical protein LC780_11265 [Acidobacteria bacterium]|nr:hypothetical protein [Acidobacteriota bacterium]